MKVLLAGYNVDTDVLGDLLKKSPRREDVTPETLSASYARISRDPRPIDQLRRAARKEVENARRSNKAIIFRMGHHSIAEHAVFNFDIIGISRLAIEEVERFRLCSYTEKSQRYITLGDDFVLPEEIKGGKFQDLFLLTVRAQNALYHKLHKRLKQYIFKKHPDLARDPEQHNLLDGWAKEDARYITSLATQGQLGQTINARNLELLLRRFASHRLSEVRDLGKRLHSMVEKVAPSIILFYRANDYDEKTYPELKQAVKGLKIPGRPPEGEKDVNLVNYTPDADNITLAALMYTAGTAGFAGCLDVAKGLGPAEKKELLKTACRYMELYDVAPREFEYVNTTYSMIISASCFAQLKRHRIASLVSQEYNPRLGVTIPDSVIDTGMEGEFRAVIQRTEEAYYKIAGELPYTAPYILTNAHRRRILFSCNARELYHISRLREDRHAQWDIRDKAVKMARLAREVMPLTMLLIGGKDSYPAIYQEAFGRPPAVTEVP